ncbi:hypothetical protein ACCO45_005021 [Purpureocillium lilacinum]|uniref:Uncharacterized protein n=1 Tax=Purpureocillium lilacinum TaxID=33203 RepID=A0ACC4DVJ2_PURLI
MLPSHHAEYQGSSVRNGPGAVSSSRHVTSRPLPGPLVAHCGQRASALPYTPDQAHKSFLVADSHPCTSPLFLAHEAREPPEAALEPASFANMRTCVNVFPAADVDAFGGTMKPDFADLLRAN